MSYTSEKFTKIKKMRMTKRNKNSAARETVYDRCAYVGCYNGKFINGRKLFHFPAETDRRLEMWIERSGNFRLRTWAATSLRKAGLCGDHFDEKSFTNATRKALRRNVVPRHYTEDLKYRKNLIMKMEEGVEEEEEIEDEEEVERKEENEMNGDGSFSNSAEFLSGYENVKYDICDDVSLGSAEYRLNNKMNKSLKKRSPSPVVEYIVEELDESLIKQEWQSPLRESIFEENREEKRTEEETRDYELLDEDRNSLREETVTRRNLGDPEPEIDDCLEFRHEFGRAEPEILEIGSTFEKPEVTEEESPRTLKLEESFLSSDICSNLCHGKTLMNLRMENKQLRKAMRLLKQNLRRSKAREANYTRVRDMLKNIDEFLNIHECTNPTARAMIKLALHKPKTPYTKEEKDFAIYLYEISSLAFVNLKRSGCNFPGRGTMKRWIGEENDLRSTSGFEITDEMENVKETFIEEPEVENDVPEMIETEDHIENQGHYIPEVIVGAIEEDDEVGIDDLIEQLEVQIENSASQERYIQALPPEVGEHSFK